MLLPPRYAGVEATLSFILNETMTSISLQPQVNGAAGVPETKTSNEVAAVETVTSPSTNKDKAANVAKKKQKKKRESAAGARLGMEGDKKTKKKQRKRAGVPS